MTPGQEQILALVSGLPSSKRYARLILMLQAYFDGSTENGQALIFAGYLASVETWLAFSDDWAELLTISPHLGSFKMSAAAQTQMERAMFHYRAIERANLVAIGCAVPLEPLAKVVRELNLEPAWTNPYFLAWRAVITLSLQGAAQLGTREPIEFIFDDQTDKVQVIRAWDHFFDSAPRSIKKRLRGAPSFKSDDDVVALQAADLLAWWARKQYVADKTRMKDLFPEAWTEGREPTLLFAEIPEKGIRGQFTKDLEFTKRRMSEIRMSASFRAYWRPKRGQPS